MSPKKKVLIIDDSDVVLQMTADALDTGGFETKTVLFPGDHETPVTLTIASYRPDLLLADVNMPEIKGNDLVRIAKASPALKGLKIYLYSSVPPDQLAELAKNANADGFIHKTKDLKKLLQKVQSILGEP